MRTRTAKGFMMLLATTLLFSISMATSAAEWTIMIYMNADNNLEPEAINNLKQMAKVGSSAEVNVVVQVDRIAKYGHTVPDWSQTLRLRITRGVLPAPANALQDLGERNMGDGATLADFVRWAKSTYPAKRYMLVIWGHGEGYREFAVELAARSQAFDKIRGIVNNQDASSLRARSNLVREGKGIANKQGATAPLKSAPAGAYRSASNDETDNDVLYNREIADALKPVLRQDKLDVLGFDTCLMAMVESAYAFRDVAKYMIGSEELEPAKGWNYEKWLGAIIANPYQDGAQISQATVQVYAREFPDTSPDGPEVTLSAIDLSHANDLARKLSHLSDTLISKLGAQVQVLSDARASVFRYAPYYHVNGQDVPIYHVDLYQFLSELRQRTNDHEIINEATNVMNELTASVIMRYAGKNRAGAFGSFGLAIYFPASRLEYDTDPFSDGGYEKDNNIFPVDFVKDFSWSNFLHRFWDALP